MARKSIITLFDWAQYPGVTISGGGFDTQYPAENMLTLQPQTTARASGGSTSFTVNLGASRTIGLIHLQNLVTDSTGTIQVTCGSYDSGSVGSWPSDGMGTYTQNLYTGLGRPRVFVPDTPVVASSVSVSITGGSICMVGFVGACEIWETPFDLLDGPNLHMQDESDLTTIPFGSTYITPRAKRRIIDFALPPLADTHITAAMYDDYVTAFDIAMINGGSSPVMIVKYPDDINNLERNSVWGLFSNATSFTNRFFGYHDAVFQIRQLV